MIKKSKKSIKRGAIKVMRRGKDFSYGKNFVDIAKHMTKQQLINHIALLGKKNESNPTYITAYKFLKFMHGMSDSDIDRAIDKFKDIQKIRQDIQLYYKGSIPAEQIVRDWGKYGISKEDVEVLATKDTYEIPKEIGTSRTLKESESANTKPTGRIVATGKTRLGQIQFNNNTTSDYYAHKKYFASMIIDGKITNNEAQEAMMDYLLGLAAARPEYAAQVSYLIHGGKISDPFDKVMTAFGKGGTREKFIQIMQSYLMKKARDPSEQRKRQERLESTRKFNEWRFKNFPTHQIGSGQRTSFGGIYQNMDPDIIGKSDDNMDIDRKKIRRKLVVKRPAKKVIRRRKVVKKCRCK